MSSIPDLVRRVDVLARGDAVLRGKLEVVAAIIVRLVDGCDSVSIAIVIEGRATTAAISDRLALEVDLVQYRAGEGPCLDALGGHVVRLDVVDGAGYERFAPGALDAAVLDVLSVPCVSDGRVVGTVNIYSRTRHGLASADGALAPLVDVVTDIISATTVLDAALDLADEATAALEEHGLVNQAVGFVAHRRRCSMEAALAFIVETAVRRGVPLRSAEAILAGHADAIGTD